MGHLNRFACFGLFLVSSLAWAQPVRPPTENVTVTSTKSREALQGFVGSLAAPTRLTGKMARWNSGICPVAVGLETQFTSFISRRVKQVAGQVGAPVSDKADCIPNIAIVFTAAPQALLDDIREKQPHLLGYYDNSPQLKTLATITHPIQAWYMTATRDAHGAVQVDGARKAGSGLDIPYPCPPPSRGICTIHFPDAQAVSATDTRLGDGLRSEFYNVVIVADSTKLLNYEMGELSDYIAMLALTRLSSRDSCRELPSIANLLTLDCGTKSSAITANDLAFLRGLYKMNPDMMLGTQKDQISYEMEQALRGQ